jgi:DNA-binding transcriptional MerR regulator
MQMGELSERSGIPIHTIKYYLRTDLLFQGLATAATRAQYDQSHLRRLRLIRALLEIGDLPLAAIQRILATVDDECVPPHQLLGTLQYALGPAVNRPEAEPDWLAACEEVDSLVSRHGWRVSPGSPARDLLISALVALRRLQVQLAPPALDDYAGALAGLAAEEVAGLPSTDAADPASRAAVAEAAVAGLVLYERVIIALRRLAQEDAAVRQFGADGSQAAADAPGKLPARAASG